MSKNGSQICIIQCNANVLFTLDHIPLRLGNVLGTLPNVNVISADRKW